MTLGSAASATACVQGQELLAWLDALHAAAGGTAWDGAVGIAGVDAWDAAFNPLYLRLLGLSRQDPEPPAPRLTPRLRRRVSRQLSSIRAWLGSGVPSPTRIMFWPREPTHLQVQVPVARELVGLGHSVGFVTSAPRLFGQLVSGGFRPIVPRASWRQALRVARRRGMAKALILGPAPALALPRPPVQAPVEVVLAILREELAQQLPEVAEAAAAAEALCHSVRPAVLVVGNDLTLEGRTAARVAAHQRVATVSLMHGLVAREAIEGRHVVDRFLAFGPRAMALLLECGIPRHQLVVTGAPHFEDPASEAMVSKRGAMRDAIERRWALDSHRPRILVATSGAGHGVSLENHRRVVAALARTARSRPGVDLVVKLHRKDRLELYDEVLGQDRPANLRVVSYQEGASFSILDWIDASSAVMTGGSTVALEAMTLGVPVITVDLGEELGAVDFIHDGATLHATSAEQLLAAVDQVLGPPEALEPLRRRAAQVASETFYRPPQGAARCAAEEIVAMARQGGVRA